jgi:ABC-type uncharacterized transport system YnjBCD permease subunit
MDRGSKIRKTFKVALLSVCTVNILINVAYGVMTGRLTALATIAINALVIYEFIKRPAWGRITTKVFAIMAIISGGTNWILLFAQRGLDEPVVLFVYRTLVMFVAIFLLRYINIGMPLRETSSFSEAKTAE